MIKNYNSDFLMQKIEVYDEQEQFEILNKRIDILISESKQSERDTLKALICNFEGYNNMSFYYALIPLTFSLIMSIISIMISLFTNMVPNEAFVIILVGLAIALAISILIAAEMERKHSIKRAFILQALRFRYEDTCKEQFFKGKETKQEEQKKRKGKKKDK